MNKLLALFKANAKQADIRANGSDVYVYDVIDKDWGASAQALIKALETLKGQPINLHINSPGGDVFEARAMAEAIKRHDAPVTAYIDGLAASAATYFALSAQKVVMSDGGLFMVHNSWTLAFGDKNELLATAELLDKIDGTIAADYAKKTGADAKQITDWMDAETWFSAEEAKAAGFVDEVSTESKAKASWDLSAYANAPKHGDIDAHAQRIARLNRSRLSLLAN